MGRVQVLRARHDDHDQNDGRVVSMTKPIELRFFVSVVGMYLLLILGLILTALRTEGILKFVTSPRRTFTQRQLLWTRWTAILGIVCFSVLIVLLLSNF